MRAFRNSAANCKIRQRRVCTMKILWKWPKCRGGNVIYETEVIYRLSFWDRIIARQAIRRDIEVAYFRFHVIFRYYIFWIILILNNFRRERDRSGTTCRIKAVEGTHSCSVLQDKYTPSTVITIYFPRDPFSALEGRDEKYTVLCSW